MSAVQIEKLDWIYNDFVSNEQWQQWLTQPIGPDRTYFKAAQLALASSGGLKKGCLFHSFYPIPYFLGSHDI
jgi:hypothetical protein